MKNFILIGFLFLVVSCSIDEKFVDFEEPKKTEKTTDDDRYENFFINKESLSKILVDGAAGELTASQIKLNQFYNFLVGYCFYGGYDCAEEVVIIMNPTREQMLTRQADPNYIHIKELKKLFIEQGYISEFRVNFDLKNIYYVFRSDKKEVIIPFKYS
ncbi:hypothetical protein [Flavobacterium sp. JP2137]|uniref:hypothetical protein n=1 Tax=Flavobacterium sp. JP2137 TaxID=3414510 RepID=UPI003D2FE909